jgi:hypothetical protein
VALYTRQLLQNSVRLPSIRSGVGVPDNVSGSADAFISKWQGVTASELSTSQSFLHDLCALIEVDKPHATPEQDYMFERPVTFQHGDGSTSAGRIDLYRRGAFVLESKKLRKIAQPKGVDEALLRARSQAEEYARALPATEGRPPFVIVVDVGARIELYSEFSRSGATYTPFPDPRSHRIELKELAKPEIRARLQRIWLDPLALDPSREAARVTRDIARQLAELARSLEASSHSPERVAQFLMRCLFTMFAEDVRLLPTDSFRNLLQKHAEQPDVAMRMIGILWQNMDSGGFSPVLAGDVLHFNGKLFKQAEVLPLDKDQLARLIDAASADWKHVEPAIFGTLLERALSPEERHKLGAHFTPRAYVERLVLPTVIEPLRNEWSDAQAAALTLATEGKHDDAVKELRRFHHRLCGVRVLDPACGSGNFLYVALEHLKRLEGEVLNALDELGFKQGGLALEGERAVGTAAETVDPHNLLGIELNPRAAAIAEVVLWIGYLQWHFRTRGQVNPPEPLIRDFRNIENRDAVLAYDKVEFVVGDDGRPLTRWDGLTTKTSPVTGEEVPDENARVPVERYVNPRRAEWPQADFVVGNPPFIGNKRMRLALGEGYAEALREAWSDVPESADLVMYWWNLAAQSVCAGKLQRFGLITTNSISQAFNRRVVDAAFNRKSNALSLAFAIPDHPWVDSTDGADVRIAMTVGATGERMSILHEVISERDSGDEIEVQLRESRGAIHSDLTVGANIAGTIRLKANRNLACPGVQLSGQGFIVEESEISSFSAATKSQLLKRYLTGGDLTREAKTRFVIDTFGLDHTTLLSVYPDAFQWLKVRVWPERQENPRESYRTNWWIHAEPRSKFRKALFGLRRFIGTSRTARFRTFQFLDANCLPETKVLVVATEEASHLGVLSSRVHTLFAERAGGWLGVGNDSTYNHSDCFEKFPFPRPDGSVARKICDLSENLDAHRKRQQSAHSELTFTGMYNVLEKLRSGEPLTAKERTIHEQGLVSALRQLHDELDAEVLSAYGWIDLVPLLRVAHGNDPPSLSHSQEGATHAFEGAVLERLVTLNSERAAEEARGLVSWLRPEFQRPGAKAEPEQAEIETEAEDAATSDSPSELGKPKPWPKDPLEQVRAVAEVLTTGAAPLTLDDITARFTSRGPWKKRVEPLLNMLVALGRVSERGGRYRARD